MLFRMSGLNYKKRQCVLYTEICSFVMYYSTHFDIIVNG